MIYSIGHGGNTPENVRQIMRVLNIVALVDVRSKPVSRWQPGFNKKALGELLDTAYLWKPDLGGLNGNIITDESLTWLAAIGETKNILIMCSESDPMACHRHTKIAARLWQKIPPVPVIHLDKNGYQRQAFVDGDAVPSLTPAASHGPMPQLSLFIP